MSAKGVGNVKKFIAVVAVLLVAFTINVQAQSGFAGNLTAPVMKVVMDTTSYSASWDNIVTVNGDGVLYQVMFNSSSASKDPSVRITVDGVVDSVSEATNEELTRYVVRGTGANLSGAGTEDIFSAVDSTYAVHSLDIPFGQQMKIDAHCEDATAQTRVWVLYGVYQ